MSLLIPPAVNYPAPLVSLVTGWQNQPVEGARMIPVAIEWGIMGGAANCVSLNTQSNTNNPITQIAALSVDNSRSGADVIFIFPDTAQTLTIPAYESAVCTVFTSATQFYISSPNAISGDETAFTIHNTVPPPVSIPKSEFQSVVVSAAITMSVAGITQLIPAGINGTIEGLIIQGSGYSAAPFAAAVQVRDGAANVILTGGAAGPANGSFFGILGSVENIQVRFTNGLEALVINQGGLIPNSLVFVTVFYRSP